ncbi:MAG: MarR family transcriptional regulator [Acidobacteriota bacterium]|nr:MAG: MarR family transcriptional regulator [Acidobacteriota bacterium]
MLLKNDTLEKIVSGEITLVFRRWKRPTVKTGGTLVTRAGLLGIDSVEECDVDSIKPKEIKAAGFKKKEELTAMLSDRKGSVYRIKVRYIGEDPRIALRKSSKMPNAEYEEIKKKLERMDASKVHGKWTVKYLELIRDNPEVLAAEIADSIGMDKPRFKANVRKLKALGLTESMPVGYRLSPRGKAVLKRLLA